MIMRLLGSICITMFGEIVELGAVRPQGNEVVETEVHFDI